MNSTLLGSYESVKTDFPSKTFAENHCITPYYSNGSKVFENNALCKTSDFEITNENNFAMRRIIEETTPFSNYIFLKYNSIGKQIRCWAYNHDMLLLCIPKYNRFGKLNKIWKNIEFWQLNKHSYIAAPMHFLFHDQVTGDWCFFVKFERIHDSVHFFLKDADSDDCDFPGGAKKKAFFPISSDQCYELKEGGIHTLRDGDLEFGNLATQLGIALDIQFIYDHQWDSYSIWFFDETYGEWIKRRFQANQQTLYFPSIKSLTFRLENEDRTKLFVPKDDSNYFRIAFPGNYCLQPNGEIFKLKEQKTPFL